MTRAMYDAGYGSSSRLYEKTASQLGMTPDKYRARSDCRLDSLYLRRFAAGADADCRHRAWDLRHPVRAIRRRVDRRSEARISLRHAESGRRRFAIVGERVAAAHARRRI